MAPTLSASSNGGPEGNSVHTTLKPAAFSLSSSVPLLLSSTSLPYFWKPMRTILSWLQAGPAATANMPRESTALAIQRRMKRFMDDIPLWSSALGVTPDDVAHGDRLRNQAELVEAIGDRLLRRDDLFGDRPDQERSAVGRDGLDLERHARHRG